MAICGAGVFSRGGEGQPMVEATRLSASNQTEATALPLSRKVGLVSALDDGLACSSTKTKCFVTARTAR